jgi:hypothetical protein
MLNLLTDFGPKIWESEINPYFKRNKFIFFILTAFLVFVPILFFPINLISDMLWGSFFYSLIYFLCLPFIILFAILGLTFSRKYLKVYERGIKIKINPLNPFSKKKKLLYNQIKTIELETTEPIIYNNKISKFLLYEPDSISTIKKTGDYSVISIITNDGKIFTTRNSFISELEIARNIISRQISKKIDVEPKIIIKKPLKKAKVAKPAKKLKLDKKPTLKVEKIKEKEKDVEEKSDFCKFCGVKLTGAKIFCNKCGKKMIDVHEINFCKYCGREISGSGEFCVKCGKEIS